MCPRISGCIKDGSRKNYNVSMYFVGCARKVKRMKRDQIKENNAKAINRIQW